MSTRYYTPAAPATEAPKDEMAQFVEEHRAPVTERAKRLNTMNQDYFRKTLTDAEYQRRFGEE